VLGVAHQLSLAHPVALNRMHIGTAEHFVTPQVGALGAQV
jgi:hypothetical protein